MTAEATATTNTTETAEPVEAGAPEPGFWALVREDWRTHGKDWTRPGFRAMFMYRVGTCRRRIKSKILRAPFGLLYRFLHRRVRNGYGIELHDTATIGRRVLIAHQGAIVIHQTAEIGDDSVLRQGVTIGAAAAFEWDKAPKLGAGVNVGAGAMILGKVKIGDGAKIGPNAVIMTNVPAYATAAAQPARIIPGKPPADG